jgi:patatin-like phospholipase/acyl hydrolase
MLIPQIENFFLEIENLIKLNLQDETLNQSEVEQKFKEGKELIDKLEEDDEERHGLFRYKYHTTYANYLKTNGEVEKANKQEKLAKKFENFSENPEGMDTYRTESRLFVEATLENINQASNQEEENKENFQETVEEELKNLQGTLEGNVIDTIRDTFKLFDDVPKSFEDYKNIVKYETILRRIADSPINESLIDLEKSQTSNTSNENQKSTIINKENKQQMISSLEKLKSLANEAAYSKRVSFINCTLNSSNKREILFGNTLFTEEEINKRFRDLALYFHSDKTDRPNTPTWLQEKHKNLGDELFSFALKFKETLLNDLEEISQNEGYLTFHEKKANNLWKIAIDYRNAAKGQWDKLKVLSKEDIEELSSDELKIFCMNNGILAYQEYRAACKIADKTKQLKKQVQLRGNMALCLYISNKFIEAQLYSLSAVQLQLKNSQNVTQQDFIETKKIFDKVKGGDPMAANNDTVNIEETSKLNTEIKLKDESNNTMALVKTVDQEISLFEKKTILDSINKDMTKISIGLMLKADRSLVLYQIPKEVILHAEKRAVKYRVAGGAVGVGGVGIGGTVAAFGCYDIYSAIIVIGTVSGASAVALAGGVLTLGLGIWAGVNLYKKGTRLFEEPKIRDTLNGIMIKTLEAYDKGEYQKFLNALSEKYDKTGESLLKLSKPEDFINTDHIINSLLQYGFRSDGIAYLLNLLGEVLSSGKVTVEGKTTKDLKALAMNVFNGALSKKLKDNAKELDDRICEIRKGYYGTRIKDFVLFKEYSNIAQEHKDDAEEMPFQSRLEEIRNITRINRAIFDILDAGEEEIERAIKTIKEVQDSFDSNYQFVNSAKWRCDVLEDLLWVISGEEPPTRSPEKSPSLITYVDNNKYINYLKKQLEQASSNQEKLRLYNAIGACYEQLAEKEDKINRLNSLRYWKAAQKNYEKACEVDSKNLDATLGFSKCLLKLSKYTQVIQLLNICPDLTSLSEYWRFRSIAYYKKADYKEAKENIIEALRLDNKNKLANEQRIFLKKLSEENTIKWRVDCYEKEKKAIKYEMDYLKSSHSKESPAYNILSIDGGGVCGILPALWLSELEYRAHRPISHLFNMIAGTSTGGIIAAGLSIPSLPSWQILYDSKKNPYYECLDSKPKFSASDILNLYQNQAKDLFTTTNNNHLWKFFKPKYTNQDRSLLFSEYFGRVRLNQALTELVIPAVNENNLTHTHLFTRHDDRSDDSKEDTFFDTLMATTAAPTFFPPYEIKGRGLFLDGALHINNPTMAAYEKAIQFNASKEKISVLSLGTGSYVPDPLNPDLYRGNLFWARNLHKVILPQQEGNVNSLIFSLLENRYQRWQIWLEEPIELDDCESIPYLLELGHQYIEELDASDDNPINKLVESFEKGSVYKVS